MSDRLRRALLVGGAFVCGLVLVWWASRLEIAAPPPAPGQAAKDPPLGAAPPPSSEPPPGPVEAAPDPVDAVAEERDPAITVRCPIALDAAFEGEVEFVEVLPLEGGGVQPERVSARIEGGVLLVEMDDRSNRGWVEIPGYPDLDWPAETEGCPPLALESTSGVVGVVLPVGGDVSVRACGTARSVDADGSFYLPAAPGPCLVKASRTDGQVPVPGDEVEVVVPQGEDVVVELRVPDEPWGTVGLTLRGTDPTRVREVLGDSAAGEAALQPGDVVLSIDERNPAECDRGWLFSCLHGPEGSVVRMEVEGRGVLELERRWVAEDAE